MILKKLRTLLLLPWQEKSLLLEALFWLGFMRLAVLTQPFQRVSTWLGEKNTSSPQTPLPPEQTHKAAQIGRAIRRIQPFTPWDSNCLAQALAARRMLQKRGIPCTTYLGAVIEAPKGIIAHAWLRAGLHIITGAQGRQRYKIVATFS
jgi:hypothetical protein